MTKAECIEKAEKWAAQAENGVPKKITMAQAGNWYAPVTAAAAIATAYATLALTVED